MTQEITDID